MKTKDPIEEVWRARDELVSEHGGDFAKYFAWLVSEQEKRGGRLVHHVPRRGPEKAATVLREEPPKAG